MPAPEYLAGQNGEGWDDRFRPEAVMECSDQPTQQKALMSPMFQSFNLQGLRLRDRIVMAPLTRSRAGLKGVPTPMNAQYYAQRASCGLIVSEAAVVSPRGMGYLSTPGLYTEEQIAGWRLVTGAVHRAQGLMFAQLWHVGRVSHISLQPSGDAPLGPTNAAAQKLHTFAWTESGEPGEVSVSPPRALLVEEMEPIVQEFVQAAKNALRAGFDGLELLAANGYLFDQFLNSNINTRTDEYGGQSPQTRARLLLETVDAICREVKGVRLGVRLSPFGTFNNMPDDDKTEETLFFIAKELGSRGIAYVHFNDEPISIGHLNQALVDNRQETEEGSTVSRRIPKRFLRTFKERFDGPIILCGALTAETAKAMLNDGLADLVAFGIPFIANPDLPKRLLHGWDLTPPKTSLFYGGGEEGYIDYACYEGSEVP